MTDARPTTIRVMEGTARDVNIMKNVESFKTQDCVIRFLLDFFIKFKDKHKPQ